MLNRAALVLKAKKPFVQWINQSDPQNKAPEVSLSEVNQDRTVYLIDDLEAGSLDEWIALNCQNLFESELEDWCQNEALWPADRDLKLFRKWFAVECHTVLIDTGIGPIIDDED